MSLSWPRRRRLDKVKMTTIERLEESLALHTSRLSSWMITFGLGVLCFIMRLVNLGYPKGLVFDETYYAKDAWTLLNLGYEADWPDEANSQVAAGNVDIYLDKASFVVHPQLGKWLIAGGEQLFGMNAFGWRIASCLFGTLLVMATVRLARRLSRSTLVGGLAGLLLCFDGLHFVMSRIALLDIFEATFTVMAVACVVADRDWFRLKLAEYLRRKRLKNLGGAFGQPAWFRPWLLGAGVLFGLAMACKWNAVYVLGVMGIFSVVQSYSARRTAGAKRKSWLALCIDGPIAFVKMVVVALGAYIASWFSWLVTPGGWGRDWGVNNPEAWSVRYLGAPLASLLHYHQQIYDFHTGDWIAQQTHTYEAHPATWPVIGRPIGIDAVNDIQPGVDGCPADSPETCLRVISAMGTPMLWWIGLLALVTALAFWLAGRDWRFSVPALCWLTPWIAWFPNADRPLFFFYAIMMIPFTCIALAMVCGKILGPAKADRRRRIGAGVVTGITVLVIANFWFIYPILTDQLMTKSAWGMRMWFNSWI